jgi:lysophospholipase L1-like esterase
LFIVLCYGDSNTYGRDAITKGRLQRDVRWPGVLQNTLGSDYFVIEEGLNGRTTVWDDPVRGHAKRNGSKYLLPCLESHSPLDLVIIMLGTNDCKARYAVTAYDIGQSIGYLVEIVNNSHSGRENASPEILITVPPPLEELTEYADTFTGGVQKSRELSQHYRITAQQFGCHFFDSGSVIHLSKIDGLHIDPEEHAVFGKSIAEKVRKISRH